MSTDPEAAAALAPGLYLVATPLGNLGDLSPRATQTLGAASLIAAEEPERARALLRHLSLRAPKILGLSEGREAQRAEQVLAAARDQVVAVVVGAGTPAISDPGYRLVSAAVEAGVAVVPIPGPCAAIVALCASGLPTDRFVFVGFLPRVAGARTRALEALAAREETLVFHESPRRLPETLLAMAEVFGAHRRAVVARELTKLHETLRRGSLEALCDEFDAPPRGEITLVVEGAAPSDGTDDDAALREALQALLKAEFSTRDATRAVVALHGVPRKRVYQLALAIAEDAD